MDEAKTYKFSKCLLLNVEKSFFASVLAYVKIITARVVDSQQKEKPTFIMD
jgi:hypothetical protein